MAATYELSETNLVGAVVTDGITSINYGSNDSPNIVVATYPITYGTNSFEKYIRLHFTNTFNKIENLQIWKSAGAYVTGEGIKTNLTTIGYSAASYATPTASTSSVATNAMPTADPTTANLGLAGSLSGSLTSVGYSDYWVTQLQTTVSTPAGNVNQKTYTIQYDES
jgi:hypothetical protein